MSGVEPFTPAREVKGNDERAGDCTLLAIRHHNGMRYPPGGFHAHQHEHEDSGANARRARRLEPFAKFVRGVLHRKRASHPRVSPKAILNRWRALVPRSAPTRSARQGEDALMAKRLEANPLPLRPWGSCSQSEVSPRNWRLRLLPLQLRFQEGLVGWDHGESVTGGLPRIRMVGVVFMCGFLTARTRLASFACAQQVTRVRCPVFALPSLSPTHWPCQSIDQLLPDLRAGPRMSELSGDTARCTCSASRGRRVRWAPQSLPAWCASPRGQLMACEDLAPRCFQGSRAWSSGVWLQPAPSVLTLPLPPPTCGISLVHQVAGCVPVPVALLNPPQGPGELLTGPPERA